MIKIDFTNILSKALGISEQIKFKVIEFKKQNEFTTSELTYLQLGTILMTKHFDIKEIHIIYKE